MSRLITQQEIDFLGGPEAVATAPMSVLVCAPDIAHKVKRLGDYLKYSLRLPERLRALSIITVAQCYLPFDSAEIEKVFEIDKSGLSADAIAEIISGGIPTSLRADELLVYKFCMALMKTGRVDNNLFQSFVQEFGREKCLEVVGIAGFTKYILSVLNLEIESEDA